MMCSKLVINQKRLPFTCPYTIEEWNIIIVEDLIKKIKNYKSIYRL